MLGGNDSLSEAGLTNEPDHWMDLPVKPSRMCPVLVL